MLYEHHHTEGLVLRRLPIGEKDLLLSVFTRDFGRITAKVKSGQAIESKLRLHTTVGSLVEITVIKSREMFRVVGLDSQATSYRLKKDAESLAVVHGLVKLLSRMIVGEEEEQNIFCDIKTSFDLLDEASELAKNEQSDFKKSVEVVAVARILTRLGYMPIDKNNQDLTKNKLDRDFVLDMIPNRRSTTGVINEAILVSGL